MFTFHFLRLAIDAIGKCASCHLGTINSLPNGKHNCKWQLMQEEARLSFFSSFDFKGFLFFQKNSAVIAVFTLKQRETRKNISHLSNLNNIILTICTANMGAATGVTLLRLNAVRAAIGKLGSPPVETLSAAVCTKRGAYRQPSGVQWRWLTIFLQAVTGVCECVRVRPFKWPRLPESLFIASVPWGRESDTTVRPFKSGKELGGGKARRGNPPLHRHRDTGGPAF